jgi:hypothetical protein
MSQKAIVDELFGKVTEAMQDAEEMGGPEGELYQLLMGKIAGEALSRASTHRANNPCLTAGLQSTSVHASILNECLGIHSLACEALNKGFTDEAVLHLGMLRTYLERLSRCAC